MPVRILVVDDEVSIRELLQAFLEEEGYTVVLASNGQDALARLAERPIAAVLLDLNMPVMDGWACLAQLRQLEPDLPVVVMTAGLPARHVAEQRGAAGFLEKPFELQELIDTVDRLVA